MKRHLSLSYPVAWITLACAVLVEVVVLWPDPEMIFGRIFLGVVVAAAFLVVLVIQAFLRWFLKRLKTPVWLRRTVMLVPVAVLAFTCVVQTLQRDEIRMHLALGEEIPFEMRDLRTKVSGLREYVLDAYFHADPSQLREFLNRAPFRPDEDTRPPSPSHYDEIFPELTLPPAEQLLVFERSDLSEGTKICTVYTDATYSFAYVQYVQFYEKPTPVTPSR